jgi:hypothetical protein
VQELCLFKSILGSETVLYSIGITLICLKANIIPFMINKLSELLEIYMVTSNDVKILVKCEKI